MQVHCAAIKTVASRLRLDLAVLGDLKYASSSSSSSSAASLLAVDSADGRLRIRALAWQAALAQAPGQPVALGPAVARLAAAQAGLLDATVR